jgi:hypothetical protein
LSLADRTGFPKTTSQVKVASLSVSEGAAVRGKHKTLRTLALTPLNIVRMRLELRPKLRGNLLYRFSASQANVPSLQGIRIAARMSDPAGGWMLRAGNTVHKPPQGAAQNKRRQSHWGLHSSFARELRKTACRGITLCQSPAVRNTVTIPTHEVLVWFGRSQKTCFR